jgi:hypothetical protein
MDTAPHVTAYFFTCSGRTSFRSSVRQLVSEFVEQYSRPHSPVIPIFVHVMKTKSLSLFSAPVTPFPRIQTEFASAQMVTIKVVGRPRKFDIRKLWQFMVAQIAAAVEFRLGAMRDRIAPPVTVDTFRWCLRLASLYDDICFHDRDAELMAQSLELLERNRGVLPGFLGDRSLAIPLDFARSCKDIDGWILSGPPCEFDFQFAFFKHIYQSFTLLERHTDAIRFSLTFILKIMERVRGDLTVSIVQFEIWVVKALADLATVCSREWETGHTETTLIFASVIEIYSSHLTKLFEEISKGGLSPPDGIQVATQEQFDQEMRRVLQISMKIYENLGYRRKLALTERKLATFCPGDSQQLKLSSASTIISSYSSFLIGPEILSDIGPLGFREEFELCAKILWDKRAHCIQPKAAERLSTLMRNEEWQGILKVNIPIRFELDSVEATVGESFDLIVRFVCGFKGELVCPRLWLSWYSVDIQSSAHFSISECRLFDGCTLALCGFFEYPVTYLPHCVTISVGNGSFRSSLPENTISIRVGGRPSPVSLSIHIPEVLLPDRWQVALVNVTANRALSQLELGVNGLAFRPAPLVQNNRVTNESETGLLYSNVSRGRFEIFLPIKPTDDAGILRVEAQGATAEVPFTVAKFLEVKLVCRVPTKVAQLSARVTAPCVVDLTGIQFNDHNSEPICAQETGLPMKLIRTTTSALFVLSAVPDSALIYVQREGIRAFSLHFNVEHLEEDALFEEEMRPMTPVAALIPVEHVW